MCAVCVRQLDFFSSHSHLVNSLSGVCIPCHYSSMYVFMVCTALQQKSHFCIPFLGIARPRSQFPYHIHVSVRFIYSQDRSTTYCIFLQHNRQSDLGIYKSLTDSWMWKLGPRHTIPFLGMFVSNFRYCVFAVRMPELAFYSLFTHL